MAKVFTADELELADRLNLSSLQLARELLILGGWDTELVIECSEASANLTECKARIIDARLNGVGRWQDEEDWK